MDGRTAGWMDGGSCRCVSAPNGHLTAPSSPHAPSRVLLSAAANCCRDYSCCHAGGHRGGVTTATAHTAPRVGVSHLRACLWLNVKAITVAAHGSLDNKMFTLGKIIALDVSVTQKPINMWLNRSGCNVSETINECNREKKRCNYY